MRRAVGTRASTGRGLATPPGAREAGGHGAVGLLAKGKSHMRLGAMPPAGSTTLVHVNPTCAGAEPPPCSHRAGPCVNPTCAGAEMGAAGAALSRWQPQHFVGWGKPHLKRCRLEAARGTSVLAARRHLGTGVHRRLPIWQMRRCLEVFLRYAFCPFHLGAEGIRCYKVLVAWCLR